MNSFADSVRGFVSGVQENTLRIPPPSENVQNWPIVGKDVYDVWSKARADLPGLLESMEPKISDLASDQPVPCCRANFFGSLPFTSSYDCLM